MNLEENLLQSIEHGKEIEADNAFLVASGVNSSEGVDEYRKKLEQIQKGFRTFIKSQAIVRVLDGAERTRKDYRELLDDAEAFIGFLLHEYFYETKPRRYNSEFLFTRVIDNQLSDSAENVGNCLGLACLYHVVGNLLQIRTVPFLTEGHIYLHQRTEKGGNYPIELTGREGFNSPSEKRGDEKNVVSMVNEIYNSRFKRCNDYNERNRLADIILKIDPNDIYLLIERGIRFLRSGKFDEAGKDLDKAIMIEPNEVSVLAYAKYLQVCGKEDDARKYARIAQKMNSNPSNEIKAVLDGFNFKF